METLSLQTCWLSGSYLFLFGKLWVEKWILGFFCLLGFSVFAVSGVKAEMGSDEDSVYSHCKMLWSNSCSKWVMRQMHFSSCCWVWSSAMYKSKGLGSLGSVLVWSGNGLFWLPTQGMQVSVVSATSLLRAGILVRILKGNLSSIQHMGMPEWVYIVDSGTSIWHANEIHLLEQNKDVKMLLF